MREEKTTAVSEHKTERMNFTDLLQQLTAIHGWKAIVSAVISFLGIHLMPVAPFLAVGTILVICDWVTGVTAATIKKEQITSRKLGKTVRKIVFYSMAIVLVMIVEKTYLKTDYLVYLVSAYISMVELYSNLENIGTITGIDILRVVKGYLKLKFIKKNKNAGNS